MLNECYRQVLKNWFGDDESKRKFIDYVIKELEKEWENKNVFIIEAPTGYGKSTVSATISLFSIKSDDNLKCIVAFPLRTLLEDQYCKFIGEHIERNSKISCEGNRSILGNFDQKQKLIGKRYMHNPDSSYLIKPITLTTVDTLALTLFGIPPESLEKVAKYWSRAVGGSLGHYLFSWASVIFSNIVLDEVHLLADSTKSLNFLIALMELSKKFNFKVILMSATIPDSLKRILKQSFSEKEMHPPIEFSIDRDVNFYKERVSKEYDVFLEKVSEKDKYRRIVEWIKESEDFRKVIVVFNTVNEAVEFYSNSLNELKEIFEDNILLLHSRFTEKDREEKIDKIKKLKNEDKYIIVSTQVIEAGVDIYSNLFITDIAPASSLIQRLGRFLRKEGEKYGRAIIWYEHDDIIGKKEKDETTKYKVYDYDLTKKTLKKLKEYSRDVDGKEVILINFHIPETKNSDKKGYKELLNIYTDEHFNIDKRAVDDFIRIFLHLENASLLAIEEFFKMEGSFIREGLQIPIAVEKDFEDLSSFVREKVVPISFEKFKSMKNEVKGVVAREEGYIPVEKDSWLSFILSKWDMKPQDLLKYMIGKEILAFIVDGTYDSEYGMRLGRNE